MSLARRCAGLLLSALLLHLVLIQPNHPGAVTWGAFSLVPLELPAILAGLVALRSTALSRLLRAALVLSLVAIAVLKSADLAMFTAFGRRFNPLGDLPLVEAGLRLLQGTIGPVAAILAALAAAAAVAALAAALWWATGRWSRLRPLNATRRVAGAIALAGMALCVADIGQAMRLWRLPVAPPGAAFTARIGVESVTQLRDTIIDMRRFERAARRDPWAGRGGLLDRIDRDVLVIFVESYGRASLDQPLYASHRRLLAHETARLQGLGLAMRSAFLEAPTRGGQSWLSHATLANGLRIDDQVRYAAALASSRETLFDIARRSGFRTAAVMPAITMDWPEGERMGFDSILAAADLGYRGKPFNWVTMPDQFTLAALDRLLRSGPQQAPLFAQVALVSSHAPWVPVPALLDWSEIGDGRVYDAVAMSGDPPEVVWRDRDRVRDQYRQAIGYTLETVFDYAARHAAEPPLMLVLGDHQAAGFVAQDASPDVPIHAIGPPDAISRLDGWGWTPGLVPDAQAPVLPMEALRDRLLAAFSSAEDPGGSG